jgi:hypothetical protein
MRKLLLVIALLGCCTWMGLFDPSVVEAATCQTTCGGYVVTCCTTGSCSVTHGVSIDCNGTNISCAPFEARAACVANCDAQWDSCFNTCEEFCGPCARGYNRCVSACPALPPTSYGC